MSLPVDHDGGGGKMGPSEGGSEQDGGLGGGQFPPSRSGDNLVEIMLVLTSVAQKYERGSRLGAALLVEGVKYFEGEGGVFDNGLGEDADYWSGTAFAILNDTFPKMMQSMADLLDKMKRASGEFYPHMYHAGFKDADGSHNGKLTESSATTISMTVGEQAAYHKHLVACAGFKGDATQTKVMVDRKLLGNSSFAAAMHFGLILKLEPWMTFSATSEQAHPAKPTSGTGVAHTQRIRDAQLVRNNIMSHQNHMHGNNASFEYFRKRFEQVAAFERVKCGVDGAPNLAFLLYLAGFIGGDGYVNYPNSQIYQSNYQFQLAFAHTIHKVLGFQQPIVVAPMKRDNNRSANTRQVFRMKFNAEQTKQLMLVVGALDYNRRTQWIVALVKAIVIFCGKDGVPNKKRVLEYLVDLLIIIRIWFPSKKKGKLVIFVGGHQVVLSFTAQ